MELALPAWIEDSVPWGRFANRPYTAEGLGTGMSNLGNRIPVSPNLTGTG